MKWQNSLFPFAAILFFSVALYFLWFVFSSHNQAVEWGIRGVGTLVAVLALRAILRGFIAENRARLQMVREGGNPENPNDEIGARICQPGEKIAGTALLTANLASFRARRVALELVGLRHERTTTRGPDGRMSTQHMVVEETVAGRQELAENLAIPTNAPVSLPFSLTLAGRDFDAAWKEGKFGWYVRLEVEWRGPKLRKQSQLVFEG